MPEYLRPGVFVEEKPSGVNPIEGAATSTACFLGAAARGRPFYPTFITSWSEYEQLFGKLKERKDIHMPLGVYHFFLNGGKRAHIVRLLDPAAKVASVDVETLDPKVKVKLLAAGQGAWANGINVTIRLSRAGGDPYEKAPAKGDPPPLFDFIVERKTEEGIQELEVLPRLGFKEDGERFYATLINRDSRYIDIDFAEGFTETLPKLEKDAKTGVWSTTVVLKDGDDGAVKKEVDADSVKAALVHLDPIDDLNMLVMPGAYDELLTTELISYAAGRRDTICILDCPGDPRNRTARNDQLKNVKDQFKAITVKDSHAALYFPWLEVADPFSQISGATRFAPPSGAIAGLFARTDNRRGVWKAPAGTEATILGAVGLAVEVTDNDQEDLNPQGINCIRQFPDSGIVCWGSRTIASRSNPEYRYVPVRRYAMFLAKSLYRGTQWVVFEPNDEPLWATIRFNLNAFMLRQFRSGALQGGKPEEAYFVKCDADNNPKASINAGEVHVTIGFAPLKPAEFVIIELTQMRQE